jgi:phage terminase small subunit
MGTYDPDAGDYGPAMNALTERQRLFVLALIDNPQAARHHAARAAGFSAVSEGSLRVCAHRLMHDDRVLAALSEETGKRFRSASLLASDFLVRMLMDEEVPMKERAKVAIAISDRGGFGAAQTINVNKTTTDRTGKAIMERIASLSQKLGVDPGKLLAGPEPSKLSSPPVVDAEFSEVKDG